MLKFAAVAFACVIAVTAWTSLENAEAEQAIESCCELPASRGVMMAQTANTATQAEDDVDPASGPKGPAPEGMVWVPGGEFVMGSDETYPEERPAHRVSVDGFWMDKHPVTFEAFAAFVEATDYKTVAERELDPADFPGVPEDLLVPGSIVFVMPEQADTRGNIAQWWQYVPGASWRHPEGPGTTYEDRLDHPVVHVAYEDAKAYADWAGKQVPTEAQWERAARGGLEEKMYSWGNEFMPGGKRMANTWQGKFPIENTADDGFVGTSPVGSFPANGYGLYDMAGNVWEWTSDWYNVTYYREAEGEHNPTGPPEADSADPKEPGLAKRVARGGSFLCAPSYCLRYRPSARSPSTPDTSTSHTGFRLVRLPGSNP